MFFYNIMIFKENPAQTTDYKLLAFTKNNVEDYSFGTLDTNIKDT